MKIYKLYSFDPVSVRINKPKMAYSRDLPKMAVMDYHGLSLTIMDCHELS